METPRTEAGRLTEEIMRIFWAEDKSIKLTTADYNRVYSHVLDTISKAMVSA